MNQVSENGRKYFVFSCDKHGEYKIRADKSNLSTTCRVCSGRVITSETFKKKAAAAHGDRYDYSLVENKHHTING